MSAVVGSSALAVADAGPALDAAIGGVDRAGVRHGFALILLSLLGGALTPLLVNPRMGVGAHTLGVLGGLVLIAMAATASAFRLSPELHRTMRRCWLGATYLNWSGTLLAGATGASFLTPIAGGGTTGSVAAEVAVIVIYVAVGVTSMAGALIAVYGLRNDT